MKAILGKKIGMTQIYSQDGRLLPVSVVHAQCTVIQKKTAQKEGYYGLQLGYGEVTEKQLSKSLKGHLSKAGKLLNSLKEVRLDADIEIVEGSSFGPDIFEVGEVVSVRGKSKGKGFAGYIKRHGFAIGPKSHGSKSHRIGGGNGGLEIGHGSKTFKGKKMPGQMGNVPSTTTGIEVVGVDVEKNLLLLKGSIPGASNSIVFIYNKKADYDTEKLSQAITGNDASQEDVAQVQGDSVDNSQENQENLDKEQN